jgi:nucleoside-diphosphate kinase
MERTLAMIKPGVERLVFDEVLKRIDDEEDMTIKIVKVCTLSNERAGKFYEVHKNSKHYKGLVKFMSSAPLMAIVLEGDNIIKRWRTMIGATDSSKADKGTIRGDFGSKTVIRENVVHGSDSPESAEFEINFFFNDLTRFFK